MVMARRMDNLDVEQVAIVTRLGREAGGNTAEVLDRVVENIRGRMELKRLVRVLTAQGRIARYILTGIPIALLLFFLSVNPEWLEPLWATAVGPGLRSSRGWSCSSPAGSQSRRSSTSRSETWESTSWRCSEFCSSAQG